MFHKQKTNQAERMKQLKKQILTFFLMASVAFFQPNSAIAADSQVEVTLPTFPVTLNGLTMEQEQNEYPLLVYHNITYVAMTYHDAQLLGLESTWTTDSGLNIAKATTVADQATAQKRYVPYTGTAKNQDKYQATRPDFVVTVNHKKIDNSKEEYPLLVFRDVTYFPLTWRFAVDEFGWDYTFDEKNGLNIAPVPTIGDTALQNNAVIYVANDIVNLREGAGTNYTQVGQVKQGEELTVIGQKNDADGKLWYQVQTGSGQEAWIASWLTTNAKSVSSNINNGESSAGDGKNNTVIYVTSDVVNLREGAGTNYAQIGQVKQGDALSVLGQKNDTDGKLWYQVQTEEGQKAWIASWLTSTNKPTANGAAVSTGIQTVLEMKPVQQDGKKTVISFKNGANNIYTIEKVNATSLQLLCDNVTLGNQTSCEGNGFTVTAEAVGDRKVRLTLSYALGNYAAITQEEDWLILNCFKTEKGLAGRTIVLDPGHGGSDVGGQGKVLGITDADVGYGVAVKLRTLLENAGANVVMTREDLPRNQKVFMTERIQMNNALEPDLFISIHGNSTEAVTKASGALVFTYNGKSYSQQYLSVNLADKICGYLKSSTGRKADTRTDNFYVLRLNNHPSVLVETAYLSNPEDEALLATEDYRQKLAEGIYAGVVDYFNQF